MNKFGFYTCLYYYRRKIKKKDLKTRHFFQISIKLLVFAIIFSLLINL